MTIEITTFSVFNHLMPFSFGQNYCLILGRTIAWFWAELLLLSIYHRELTTMWQKEFEKSRTAAGTRACPKENAAYKKMASLQCYRRRHSVLQLVPQPHLFPQSISVPTPPIFIIPVDCCKMFMKDFFFGDSRLSHPGYLSLNTIAVSAYSWTYRFHWF